MPGSAIGGDIVRESSSGNRRCCQASFGSQDAQNVLLRRNRFEDVTWPMFDDKGEPLAGQVE